MKRLLFLIAFLGTMGSLWAQATENLFEWQGGNRIIPNGKFLEKYKGIYTDYPTYIYKEYDISINKENSYILKMKGFDKTMSDLGTFDGFEIYHEGKKILDYLSYGHLFDVRYITEEKCRDYFIKVTLSNESFALFFGGWLFGGDETPEMVVVVVSGDKAKVVFDDYAYAYKYTPGEHFSIEYVDDINGLRAIGSPGFTDSYLKKWTKYKIWREGNMLKYKSWK